MSVDTRSCFYLKFETREAVSILSSSEDSLSWKALRALPDYLALFMDFRTDGVRKLIASSEDAAYGKDLAKAHWRGRAPRLGW